jgi:hypothetical protein
MKDIQEESMKTLFNLIESDFKNSVVKVAFRDLKSVLNVYMSMGWFQGFFKKYDDTKYEGIWFRLCVDSDDPKNPITLFEISPNNIKDIYEGSYSWVIPMTLVSNMSILSSLLDRFIEFKSVKESKYKHKSIFQVAKEVIKDLNIIDINLRAKQLEAMEALDIIDNFNKKRNKFVHRIDKNGKPHQLRLESEEVIESWVNSVFLLLVLDELINHGLIKYYLGMHLTKVHTIYCVSNNLL